MVKALHPLVKWADKYRTFIEVHFAKSRRVGHGEDKTEIPHVVTTSYLTHGAIESFLARHKNYGGYPGRRRSVIWLRHWFADDSDGARSAFSLGRNVAANALDEQAQKVRDSLAQH